MTDYDVRTDDGLGATGAASARVGVLLATNHGASMVDVLVRVAKVVVGVVVVDALVKLSLALPVASQRL
jgi:hypothetical protein